MLKSRLAWAFLFASLFAMMNTSARQPGEPYQEQWKKVEDFVNKEQPQSALAEVKKIYALADRDKQEAQLIKCLLFMSHLQQENREDNARLVITEWEAQISGKSPAVQAIMYSFLAELYWRYFQNNRWRLYDRTAVSEYDTNDIDTWPTEALHEKIAGYYKKSLQNEALLQQTPLDPYNAIIKKGNARYLRPTLFDLLAHRALSYFRNTEIMLKQPAYAFEIDQASAFDPAADFVHRKFETRDTSSLMYQALLLYQRLIRFHLNDEKPEALADADLDRLDFVRSSSTHPDKDELYYMAVNHIAHQYGSHPVAANAWFKLASYHYDRGMQYSIEGDSTLKNELVKAAELCRQVLDNPQFSTKEDTAYGWYQARALLASLQRGLLEFQVELVNTPSLPFRALVTYRNTGLVHLRIYRWDESWRDRLSNTYDPQTWVAIERLPVVRKWQQPLPDPGDYQKHRAEVKIDGLEPGKYILVAGNAASLADTTAIAGMGVFHVSNISYINNKEHFFVLHRQTGQPLAGAKVQEWRYVFDSKQSKRVLTKLESYTTDKNGYYQEKLSQQEASSNLKNNYLLELTYGKDHLFLDGENYNWHRYSYYNYNDTKTPSIFLFTDRSIYRPGQTVFAKGIILQREKDGLHPEIRSNHQTVLYLRGANRQIIDSVAVTSNEYGSFNARFTLPSTGLTGNFSFTAKQASLDAYISVEEYKRPKFEVSFEPVKESFRVGDSIRVTGLAKAYAGNNIDGATVSYRVERAARIPYPWFRSWYGAQESMEIAHGTTQTDAEGKFLVSFPAIADKKLDPAQNPFFDYVIHADITDMNGETRSGQTQVTAGYTALQFQAGIPQKLLTDSVQTMQVSTRNTAGEFVPALVTVAAYRLKPESRLIRKRLWEQPDQFVLSKAEYVQYFPNDEYNNESDYRNWEKEKLVLTQTDSTKADGRWDWGRANWAPGVYVVELNTTDKYGRSVKEVRFTELFSKDQQDLNQPEYLWNNASSPIEPGDSTAITFNTAASNLFLIHVVNRPSVGEKPVISYINWAGKQRKMFFPATDADRGGYGVTWAFIKDNRIHQFTDQIEVPWSNKELQVEYLSWRDKTLPGSSETWKVRLSGHKKNILAAEMLASMYDASLDQFKPHQWRIPSIYRTYYPSNYWDGHLNFSQTRSGYGLPAVFDSPHVPELIYEELLSFIYPYGDNEMMVYGSRAMSQRQFANAAAEPMLFKSARTSTQYAPGLAVDNTAAPPPPAKDEDGDDIPDIDNQDMEKPSGQQPAPRKNFNETAFFFPDLRTDSTGAIEFSFTVPEALTRWKFQALAHTKDLAFGYSSKEMITQKQLMIQPNPPRFLREGDQVELSAKVVNLTEKELTGQARLELLDAATGEPLDSRFRVVVPRQYFTAPAGQSTAVNFQVEVPFQFNTAVTWRMIASADNYSDGEEASLPVLSNRLLVTESITLSMKGTGTRSFSFDKLKQSGQSGTLQHHRLTVEYSSNPAWYAVQALPYLMEFPYECAEQTWNRYYSNALASYIAGSSPRIREIFEKWKTTDTSALLSNLQKNQELKNILLEETPWVLEARSEAEQKRNIALLFDMLRMRNELAGNLERLNQMMNSSGAFPWFKGGPDDRYITQYIITGIGHLKKLNAIPRENVSALDNLVKRSLNYLDYHVNKDYEALIRSKTDLKKYRLSHFMVQYLYMRSFFPDINVPEKVQKAVAYFRSRLTYSWTGQNKYMQGMTALVLHRQGNTTTAKGILKSLLETSVYNEELGRYHKSAARSWWWYEAPTERQALMVEAFLEIANDRKSADEWRTWLLKHKQTNRWETTRATAEACYALLLQSTDWLQAAPTVTVRLGDATLSSSGNAEAGTGYFKQTIAEDNINPNMGNIQLELNQPQGSGTVASSWGTVYWQYFEDMDKVTTAATPLQLKKQIYVQRNSDKGPVLEVINEGDYIRVGDKVVMRIELRVDRDMEYVHMKDLRASGLEPVNVLSSYKWQGGLGYYESTRDAATHFFFQWLRRGTYVFEYSLFASHAGDFSNGITSIECMYAPEFRANSEGIRVRINGR